MREILGIQRTGGPSARPAAPSPAWPPMRSRARGGTVRGIGTERVLPTRPAPDCTWLRCPRDAGRRPGGVGPATNRGTRRKRPAMPGPGRRIVADANRALDRYRMTGWKMTCPFSTSLPGQIEGVRHVVERRSNSTAAGHPGLSLGGKQSPMGAAATIVGTSAPGSSGAVHSRPPSRRTRPRRSTRSGSRRAERATGSSTLHITFAGPAARRNAPCLPARVDRENPRSSFTLQLQALTRAAVRH